MSSLQSVLGRAAGRSPTTETELREMAARAYRETGFICLKPEWILSWPDREFVNAVAMKVHGKRRQGGK